MQKWVAALVIAAFVLIASACMISTARADTEILYEIPAQSLETALEAFGAKSRFQVLYETALTSGRRSSEVKGWFTREDALRLLLKGTGLTFTYTDELAFTLQPERSQSRESRSIADFNQFLGTVQAKVMTALCRSAETRPGPFRLAMQFWINGSGKIENPILLSSTGTPRRDVAIIDVMNQVAFLQSPPANMPQPVTMVLKPGPADAHECRGSAQ